MIRHKRQPPGRRLRRFELVSLDFDGVLASQTKYFGNDGQAFVAFDAHDGLGVELLIRCGITVAVITSSRYPAAELRAKALGIPHIRRGVVDKGKALRDICEVAGISPAQTLHVGDDIWDLNAFDTAGLRVAVRNAHRVVRKRADWVTRAPGGAGAVREISDALLRARGVTLESIEGELGCGPSGLCEDR